MKLLVIKRQREKPGQCHFPFFVLEEVDIKRGREGRRWGAQISCAAEAWERGAGQVRRVRRWKGGGCRLSLICGRSEH